MGRTRFKFVVGVDEVGRGPLAGPVTVGVLVLPIRNIKQFISVKDSKKLSSEKREEMYKRLLKLQKNEELSFAVVSSSNNVIDRRGISEALRIATEKALSKLKISPGDSQILLDGLLYAPQKFRNQKTIIKGDEKIPVIALASIVAKVTRDKYMIRLARKYPKYGFEIHKGYGTARHRAAIRKFGVTPIHRKSFLKNLSDK
jgi:ribonuclease HII